MSRDRNWPTVTGPRNPEFETYLEQKHIWIFQHASNCNHKTILDIFYFCQSDMQAIRYNLFHAFFLPTCHPILLYNFEDTFMVSKNRTITRVPAKTPLKSTGTPYPYFFNLFFANFFKIIGKFQCWNISRKLFSVKEFWPRNFRLFQISFPPVITNTTPRW